jgi:transcription elongation factor S-II
MSDVRHKVVQRFAAVLGSDDIANALEISLYNRILEMCIDDRTPRYWENARFRYRYTTKALSLEFNLKNPKNPAFRAKVLSKALSTRQVVRMSPSEMFPELYEDVYAKIASRQLRRMAPSHANAPDGAYTCRKCGSKKTVYTSVQIRSADEPMTTFVTCLGCGKHWKD